MSKIKTPSRAYAVDIPKKAYRYKCKKCGKRWVSQKLLENRVCFECLVEIANSYNKPKGVKK